MRETRLLHAERKFSVVKCGEQAHAEVFAPDGQLEGMSKRPSSAFLRKLSALQPGREFKVRTVSDMFA